jgi:hypothetical protein
MMSYDDQHDPNQQDAQSQDQFGQQDPSQQGAAQQDPQSQNQGNPQDPNQQNPNQQGQGMLGGLEQQAQQQVDQGIDQLAQKVPGGEQFSQQAKDASAGILSNVEGKVEGEAEQRLGGLGVN